MLSIFSPAWDTHKPSETNKHIQGSLIPLYALSRGFNKVSVLLLYWSLIYAWWLIAVNDTSIKIHARKLFEHFCRVGTERMAAAPFLQYLLQRLCRALADAAAAQEADLSIGDATGHWLL